MKQAINLAILIPNTQKLDQVAEPDRNIKWFQVKYRSNVQIKENFGKIKHFIQQHNKLSRFDSDILTKFAYS